MKTARTRDGRPGDKLPVRNNLRHPRQKSRQLYRRLQGSQLGAYAGQGFRDAEQGARDRHVDLVNQRLLSRLLQFENSEAGLHQPHVGGDARIPVARRPGEDVTAKLWPGIQPGGGGANELQILKLAALALHLIEHRALSLGRLR